MMLLGVVDITLQELVGLFELHEFTLVFAANIAKIGKPDIRHDQYVVDIVLIAHYFSSTRLLLTALMIHI